MSLSPALRAYLLGSLLAGPLAGPLLRRRLGRGKEDGARLAERLGRAGLARPEGRLVWLHGASVGEAMSALPLIAALGERTGAACLLTTGTVTSAARVAPLLPRGALHQFAPVDTAGAVGRFLDHWHPDLAVWIESELWPRLIVETAGRAVPMALVNARLSAASAARWGRAPGMLRALLGRFRLILAQDEETVARLARFGVEAGFAGNLKALVAPVPAPLQENLAEAVAGRPVWLAASTHPGEEAAVAEAHLTLRRTHPTALAILAPRHPERGAEVAALLARAGLGAARRSAGEAPGPAHAVWLADTLGEMDFWYRLAPVVFVGGSLAPRGGHTPFEPIAHGAAVLHGPHTENFAPAYRALAEGGGAVAVAGPEALAREVGALLADPARRDALAEAARAVHGRLKPDLDAMASRLAALIGGPR